MKYMNEEKKYGPLNLQFFSEEDGGDGSGSGEGDDQDDGESDDDGEENDPDEKKYSQKDMDNAVEKRLARERRKWKKEQQKNEKHDGNGKTGDGGEESEDAKARKAAESRATKAEARVACYEAGVAKESVDDAIALAKSYMENDENLDLEEAIEKVVKKYPHFKKEAANQNDDRNDDKSWGQRQSGKGYNKMSGVEKRFYELNPDLKK